MINPKFNSFTGFASSPPTFFETVTLSSNITHKHPNRAMFDPVVGVLQKGATVGTPNILRGFW